MVETAEAGSDIPSRGLNGHVAEGYVVAHMSAEWAKRKVAGCSQRRYRCRRSKLCRLWCASGDGGTGMLKGTANGNGEQEGTEHEFLALEIYFESVSFHYIVMENER